MSVSNPYSTPAALGAKNLGTGSAMEPLQKTRPWVMFLGILGMIGSVGILGMGVLFLILGTTLGSSPDVGYMATLLPALVLLLSGILYLYPSWLLIQYSMAIGSYVTQPSGPKLAQTLDYQRKFWQFLGILTILSFLLNIIISVVAMSIGMFAAQS